MLGRRRRRVLAVALVTVAVGAPAALASFSPSTIATGPLPVSSETLADPTGLAATNNKGVCKKNNAKTLEIDLSWTASTSTNATGYLVLRTDNTTGGTTQVATVTPVTATSWKDTTKQLAFSTSYTYTVQTNVHSWTSPGATVTITTLNGSCA